MIHFITGNKNKFAEIKSVIETVDQLDIDLPEIQEIDARKVIEAKLLEARAHHSGSFIVEDTSLYLNCLNGLPGPLIKWFMKTIGNEGLYKITEGFQNNAATARTILGYASENGELVFFEGTLEGTIVAPRGDSNFGWDPIFQPINSTKTFAEMGTDEKNKISMRRMAADKLKNHLDSNIL